MALELENINNFISDDLDLRNRNWTNIDDSLDLKADKTYVDSQDALKADKTYVDSKVKTDVPVNAKFTDTITTINGKTGTIAKADIVALGVPAQDTVYTHPTTHSISEVSGLQTALDGKVDDSQVLTNVPLNAKFTDTVYSHPSSHPASMITDLPTSLPANGGNADTVGGFTVGVSVPADAKFTDTVYAHPPGTNPHGTTKSDVGLGNVTNDKQMPISNGVLENYREKLVTLSGTSTAINLSLGNVFTHSLTGNTTYSITNAVSGQAHSFTLIVNMDSTVRTLTFPASVKWQGGEIPDLSTASKTYVLTFMTVDGGTTWLGMFGGEF